MKDRYRLSKHANPFVTAAVASGIVLGFPVSAATAAQQAKDQPGQGAAAPRLTEQAIADAVDDELRHDLAVDANTILVRVSDGVVTLSGHTDNILAKERATRLAESVKGVRSVVNRISVRPPVTREGEEIRADVLDALASNRATESFEIRVTTSGAGQVTLAGKVDSWQECQLAETMAKGVTGVLAVNNEIEVNRATTRTDQEIATDIEAALRWDALVDDALIRVSVEDGVVTLNGTVGSAAEKRRAIEHARTDGVSSVEASGLKVARWARDEDLRGGKYADVSPSDIEAAVKAALERDPRVAGGQVEVEADAGTVTLRGSTDTLAARRAAERDARNTVGVENVVNRLKVVPETPAAPAELERKLERALDRDPYVEPFEIDAEVYGGTAYLGGTVSTYQEKLRAEHLASGIEGITSVSNNLVVSYVDRPYSWDPYLNEMTPAYDYDWYAWRPRLTGISDRRIREEVNDEMFWSPFVDADEVTVKVNGGTVTLTGTVDSWGEKRAARENAYEGGASWVVNRLRVENAITGTG